jgi:hypothetical protein
VSVAYRCEVCGCIPHWRLEREGDAVVTWSCDLHLTRVLFGLRRSSERTRVVVQAFDPDVSGGVGG